MKVKKLSIIGLVQVSLASFVLSTGIADAGTVSMAGPDSPHMSTLQVKSAVKKKHKGRVIYIERKPTSGHPNCHTVKMITVTGEFRYIRYACGR